MPRHKAGLERGTTLREGRKRKADDEYAAGWLSISGRPSEDLIRLGGFAYSELFVGADTRNIYKVIKRSNEWFRFAFVVTDD